MPRVTNQTGLPLGTFKCNDKHPTIDGLVYKGQRRYSSGNLREIWKTLEQLENQKKTKRESDIAHDQTPARIARNKELTAKYKLEDPQRFKDTQNRWRARNKEQIAAKNKLDRAKRPEHFAQIQANRRALKLNASLSNNAVDRAIIANLYVVSRRLSDCTGFSWEVDHIVPLSLGGSHTPNNLQVVPKEWNRVKSNKNTDKIKTL